MQTILDGRITTERAALALGMFDGVHIGHKVLLQKAKSLAQQRDAKLVACTFLSHPMSLIAPEKCPPMLSTFDERAHLMEALGVDILYAMPFDKETMNMPPEVYVGELVRRFHPTDVVCGYNHSFGKKGQGSPALLSALGDALGFATSVVPKITLDGREVSSTAIRTLLSQGQVKEASELLGRPYNRHAALAARESGVCELVMTPNGKQDVPQGRYRAAWRQASATYPMLLNVEREGRANCRLPDALSLHSEVELLFLSCEKKNEKV